MTTLSDNILNRRSIRSYEPKAVSSETIKTILNAAIWAPSGNNLQPWKFSVIMENKKLLDKIASLSIYQNWIKTAPCLIAVFLDHASIMTNITIPKLYIKHVQAIGAALQNMLLTANDLGLGTCWIGEILKNEEEIKILLNVPAGYELMAVVSVGYPKIVSKGQRKPLDQAIIDWQ
ncbi:nitroreductase family protein [Pectinatus frisingensis]|jgi:nitroreductase|uniref:nitroreductase family protein n=1 Tax=Pectinatus frisingensis TaxID=865 RepID=UPI0015F6AE99|nr:nitroreductase family protein [Pectinatus frisingensis]